MANKTRKRSWTKGWSFIHINTKKIRESNAVRRKWQDGEISEEVALTLMPDAITVKQVKTNTYGSTVLIYHPVTGEELGWFEHTPFDPYSCGAQIVFKTKMGVKIFPHKTDVRKPEDRMECASETDCSS